MTSRNKRAARTMKAAAKRVASSANNLQAACAISTEARWDSRSRRWRLPAPTLIARGEKPTMRRSPVLGVSQLRVEEGWPQGVPLDGAGEFRAACASRTRVN